MQKKALLITILQKLQPYREQAEGFLAFVESEFCSEESVESLLKHLQQQMQHIELTQQQNIQKQQSQIVAEQQEKDIQEAQALLSQFTQ